MSTHAATIDRPRLLGRLVLESCLLLWIATLLFAVVALPFTGDLHGFVGLGLAPHRSVEVVLAILARNIRVAALPFLFAATLKAGSPRLLRRVGDVAVATSLAANVGLAGVALAVYGPGLLVVLPHWPLEWAGFAIALSAWRRVRTGTRHPLELALLAIACTVCLVTGALIETYLVPGG